MKEYNFYNYLKILKQYYWNTGIIPTFEVMKNYIWFKSNNSVTRFYQKACELWFLDKEGGKYLPTYKLTSFNVYWSIIAWVPEEVQADNVLYDIEIGKYLIWNYPDNIVLIQVKGVSMQDIWIMEWDVVVVDKSCIYPNIWDIVVANVDWDNEFTLKTYSRDISWKVYLKAENEDRDLDVYPSESIKIIGVVKWLIRKF